jgi:RNA polymerase sigma factor (sigma-70 family)
MSALSLRTLMRQLHRLVRGGSGDAPDDAELLRRFAERHDEAAFEVLVWRHGPMVLNVCRRLLHREQDAEDAFQATFLVLARKAAAISRRESVGGWLYRVAYRTARRAQAHLARRAEHEAAGLDVDPAGPAGEESLGRDLRPVLDEEISRLPEKYRLPVLLCYLEGRTNEEAACELGVPKGTIATRLAWARQQLRERLTRLGVTVGGAALAVLAEQNAVGAALAKPLAVAAVRAAIALTRGVNLSTQTAGPVSANAVRLAEGVLHSMRASKLKAATAVVLGLVALAGAGVVGFRALSAARNEAEAEEAINRGDRAATQTVRGRVVDQESGAGVAGVELWVMQALDGGAVSIAAQVVTDAEGRYTAKVRRGKVVVQVMGSPDSHLKATAMQPTVAADGTEYPTIRLGRAAAVEGVVVGEDGKAVAGATVWTVGPQGMAAASSRSWPGDLRGHFIARGLPLKETVPLRARTDDAVSRAPTVLVPAAAKAPVRLEVSPKNAFRVRAGVTDGQGKPVPGATVSVEWSYRFAGGGFPPGAEGGSSQLEQHITDAAGRFESKALWAGDLYRIQVTASGFGRAETEWTTGEPGGVHDFGRITLTRTDAAVGGLVLDSAGRPVAGVRVFNRGDGARPVSSMTDADGKFRLGGLSEGAVYVFAEKEGYRFAGVSTVNGAEIPIRLVRSSDPPPPWPNPRARLQPEEERQFVRRLLKELWGLPPEQRQKIEAQLLRSLARLDPAEALRWSAQAGGKNDHVVRGAIAEHVAGKDVEEALAILAGVPNEYVWLVLRQLASRHASRDPARALRFAEQALLRARTLAQPVRCAALADAGNLLCRLGKTVQGRAVIEEAAGMAEKLGADGLQELARAKTAVALAAFDRTRADALLAPLAKAPAIARHRSDVAVAANDVSGVTTGHGLLRLSQRLAADRPDDAVRLAETIRDVAERADAFAWLAVAIAPADRERAWRLIDRSLSLCLREAEGGGGLRPHGGCAALAARVACQAVGIGYPDVASLVYRVLATRPTPQAGSLAAVAEAQVAQALFLATFDPATAWRLLELVGPRSALVGTTGTGAGKTQWLQAWALADPQQFAALFEGELAAWSARPGDGAAGVALARAVDLLTIPRDERAEYLARSFRAFWQPAEE